MKVLKYLLPLFLVAVAGFLFLHKDTGKGVEYVSSDKCQSCHQSLYDGWKSTLHPKMFKPVTSPDDILGDFTSDNPALTFKKEDVEYVVGSKWEQVYVKIIDGEYYPLPAKWYISTQHWVPYKAKNWQKVEMSKKCNGCHTTGFNPGTFEFKEFGIGCEACHGPGSIHVNNRKKNESPVCFFCHATKEEFQTDIISTVDSSVCGQCHNRGVNKSVDEGKGGSFNFPVKFTPGKNLKDYFIPITPESDKNRKFWWGNGVSKNRHQEFADWNKSTHSKAHKLLKENYTKDRGELTDECLKCHSTEYRFAKPGKKPDLDSVQHGITCVACHNPHGKDKQLPFVRDGTAVCGQCHIDSMAVKQVKKGKPHYPCPSAKVSCADCHMPLVVTSGGDFTIRSHAFSIIKPAETRKIGLPNSCQNGKCHMDKDLDWAEKEFNAFYEPQKS